MNQFATVLEVVLPIFVAVFLGVLARKKEIVTPEGNRGLQKFVTGFGLPCVVFNSCLTASIGAEALTSMALALIPLLIGTFWAFGPGKKHFPYHNLPQMFAAQETGMLAIPLFMTLFGAAEAYRVGVLDLAQTITAFPTIAILSANVGENPTPGEIVKKVLKSPLLIMALSGLVLNLSGGADWLEQAGMLGIITETTGFLAQPVSAVILFSVGYNFSLAKGNRQMIFRLCTVHFVYFAAAGLIAHLVLFLIPNVDPLTRWAMLIFSIMPASYLAPTLGKSEEDFTVASGVCSVLTAVALVGFCIIAAIVA